MLRSVQILAVLIVASVVGVKLLPQSEADRELTAKSPEANLTKTAELPQADPQFMAQGLGDIFRRSRSSGRSGGRGGRRREPTEADRDEYPRWEVEKQFKHDSFTFARVQFDGGGRGSGWSNDYPDCDWNFSVRLNELTAMQVDPNGTVLRLTDESLFEYPFLFMSNPNHIDLSQHETLRLREYLLRGGFLMVDDFWAPAAWRHVYQEFKRVFPDREPRELPRDHEIFRNVYVIQGKPQVPSYIAWSRGDTFEYWHGDPQGDEDPHFWGFFDDDDRLMALLCHNNDVADGWEREGENKEYFLEYAERVSYPLGINIVTYAMTH